jgi:hypothetical protein
MKMNIISYKQSGGVTAERVSLKNANLNGKIVTEGIWTKLGVIIAFLALLFTIFEYMFKFKL